MAGRDAGLVFLLTSPPLVVNKGRTVSTKTSTVSKERRIHLKDHSATPEENAQKIELVSFGGPILADQMATTRGPDFLACLRMFCKFQSFLIVHSPALSIHNFLKEFRQFLG